MNDIIVSVNGVSTVNVSHEVSVDALKKAGKVVTLVCHNTIDLFPVFEHTTDCFMLKFNFSCGERCVTVHLGVQPSR